MGWREASKFSGEAMTIVQYSNLILRAVQMRCTKIDVHVTNMEC